MGAGLIRAAATTYRYWVEGVARATGGRIWIDDGMPCAHQPPPNDELIIPFPARAPEAALDRAIAFAQDQRLRHVALWETGLHDEPALRRRLLARGFAPGWDPHWMAAPAVDDAANDPRVAIEREMPEYDAYGQALLRLTASERFVHLSAREDGAWAGRAWVVTAPGCAAAGVFDMHVEPRFHRRGLGAALTSAALRIAAEGGCTHIALNATGEGEQLYRAAGFDSLGHGGTWYRP